MTVDKAKMKSRAEQLMSEHSGAEFDPIPAIPVAASDVLALLAEIDQLKGIHPGFPPRPPEGEGLPRYGLRWNGPQQPLATPMDDGYWTPWHLADQLKSENEALRKGTPCVDDLSALVRQLVHRLRKAAPDNDLPEKALDYLKRKGLQGSPLRTNQEDPTERAAQDIYKGWSEQEGFVPWVPGGNSLKQDEARRLARNAISDDKKTGD
jgi:hypothetical protein